MEKNFKGSIKCCMKHSGPFSALSLIPSLPRQLFFNFLLIFVDNVHMLLLPDNLLNILLTSFYTSIPNPWRFSLLHPSYNSSSTSIAWINRQCLPHATVDITHCGAKWYFIIVSLLAQSSLSSTSPELIICLVFHLLNFMYVLLILPNSTNKFVWFSKYATHLYFFFLFGYVLQTLSFILSLLDRFLLLHRCPLGNFSFYSSGCLPAFSIPWFLLSWFSALVFFFFFLDDILH